MYATIRTPDGDPIDVGVDVDGDGFVEGVYALHDGDDPFLDDTPDLIEQAQVGIDEQFQLMRYER